MTGTMKSRSGMSRLGYAYLRSATDRHFAFQTISDHGGCGKSAAEGSEGISGFVTRCVNDSKHYCLYGGAFADRDTLQAMTASQMRIAETIDAFYGEAGTRDGVSRSYKQAVEDLDAETIKALDGPYRYDWMIILAAGKH
jgi:hypothetical protein